MALVLGQTYIKEPGRPMVGVHRVKVLATTADTFTIRPVQRACDIYVNSNSLASAPVQATGTLTLTGAFTANDEVIVGPYTYVAKASPGAAYEVDVEADQTNQCSSLVSAISADGDTNAYYVTGTIRNPAVTATSAAGVVTLTARKPGSVGNAVAACENIDAGGVIAATGMSGGTGADVWVAADSDGRYTTATIEGGVVNDELEIITVHGSDAGVNTDFRLYTQ